MKMITHLFVSAIAIVISAYIVPGVTVTLVGSLILAVVLGVINIFIKPIIKIIALPITILTLGMFSLVINALFIIFAGKIVPDFSVSGFWPAFWFAIVLSFINAFFNLFKEEE